MKEYTADEYTKAEDTINHYEHRAIEVMQYCGVEKVRKWHRNCLETFVHLYTQGDEPQPRVNISLFMGEEFEPPTHTFVFPWFLMNMPNAEIPDAYAKWRKAEDEAIAKRKAEKEKHWAEVRAKYLAEHPEEAVKTPL